MVEMNGKSYKLQKDSLKRLKKAYPVYLLKKELVQHKGGKCEKCGGEFPTCCYHFHHKNPETKQFNISAALQSTMTMANIIAEVDKCLLVCANCHLIIHAGELRYTKDVPNPITIQDYIDYYNDNNSEHLFNKLLALIQEKKITIYKLSQELNLNYLTIHNWVNKGKKPRIKTLVLIRKYFQQIT